MKIKQVQELRNESVEKLMVKVTELKSEIAKVSMPRLGETRTNAKIAHNLRRDIAQIKTIITELKTKENK